MRVEEAVLFLVVTVLSFALVATIVAPLIRKKRVGPGPAPGPFDALAALRSGEAPPCATCRRRLLPGFRFCPFDGTPLGDPGSPAPVEVEPGIVDSSAIPRKICPRCARAYRQDTSVCARDGMPLVPVN